MNFRSTVRLMAGPATALLVVLLWGPVTERTNMTQQTESPANQPTFRFEMEELRQRQADSGKPWLEFLNVDSMYCGVYHLAAGATDGQSPHTEDEIYYVVAGRGGFELDGEEMEVGPGTVLYVPARRPHRFVDITEDLTMLVVFPKN